MNSTEFIIKLERRYEKVTGQKYTGYTHHYALFLEKELFDIENKADDKCNVSNCDLLQQAEKLTSYSYDKMMSGKWVLTCMNTDTVVCRKDSKKELIDYVINHC